MVMENFTIALHHDILWYVEEVIDLKFIGSSQRIMFTCSR
jgi:hypothetical protein